MRRAMLEATETTTTTTMTSSAHRDESGFVYGALVGLVALTLLCMVSFLRRRHAGKVEARATAARAMAEAEAEAEARRRRASEDWRARCGVVFAPFSGVIALAVRDDDEDEEGKNEEDVERGGGAAPDANDASTPAAEGPARV